MLDNYIFFYSLIVANNPDSVFLWDDFIDALDNDKKLIEQLNKFLAAQENKNNIFNEEDSKVGDIDSKKTNSF